MKLKWALRFLLFVVGTATAFGLVLRTNWAAQNLCRRGMQLAHGLTGAVVMADRCTIDPLGGQVEIDGLTVGPEHGSPVFRSRRILAVFAPLQAFGGRLALARLEVDGPELALRAGAGGGGKSAHSGCLAVTRRIRVGQLLLRDGRADVALEGDRLLSIRELSVESESHGGLYRVVLHASGAYEDPALHVPVDRLGADVSLDTDGESATVRELDLQAAGTGISVSGTIRNVCDPEPDLLVSLRADLPAMARLLPSPPALKGSAFLQLALRGSAADPIVAGTLDLRDLAVNDIEPGAITARFHADGERLWIDQALWPFPEGRAEVSAKVIFDKDLTTHVEARTDNVPFEQLMARLPVKNTPVMMRVDSRHVLDGKLLGGLIFRGHSEVDIRDFKVRTVPWHQEGGRVVVAVPKGRVESNIVIDPSGITLPDARVTVGPGDVLEAPATLSFREARGLTIHVHAPSFDLAHVGGAIARVPVAGAGSIDALVEGPYPRIRLGGEVRLAGARLFSAELGELHARVDSDPTLGQVVFSHLEGQRGSTAYDADVDLELGPASSMDGTLSLRPGGRLADLFGATARLLPALSWLSESLDGRVAAASAHVHGPFLSLSGEASASAADVRFLDCPFDLFSADMKLDRLRTLVFERAEAIRSGGRIDARGSLDLQGRAVTVKADVEGAGLPIKDLLGAFGTWADMQGTVAAQGSLSGPTDDLAIQGALTATSLAVRGVALPDASLHLSPGNGAVEVEGPVCGAGKVTGAVQLASGLPFQARLGLVVTDLARYLPSGARVGGSLRGMVTAAGTLADITSARGKVELDELALSVGDDYRVHSTGRVLGSYAGLGFEVQQLLLEGENTRLTLVGNRSAEGRFDLRASGNFDGRLLGTVVPAVENPSGKVEIQAQILGTADQPVLVGSAQMSDGSFRLRPLPITIRGLSSKLTFSQNQVIVEDARMTANGGQLKVRGTVAMRDWAPTTMDLTAEGERVSWAKPEEWPAILSGRLQLDGSWPRDLRLSGRLTVDRLRYTKDLDLERAAFDFSKRVALLTASSDPEWIHLDIDLLGGADMRVDNNLVKARLVFAPPNTGGEGRLRLVGTNAHLTLLGSVEIQDAVAFFRGNEYRVTHGVVEFEDREKLDPQFDILADTTIRDYRVTVHAFGRLGDGNGPPPYVLQLASDPSLPQSDIVTLLTFGITSGDIDRSTNAAAGAGVAAEALLAVSGLEQHLRRFFPRGKLIQDPDFSLTSQYSDVTGQLEPMASFEARLLTERLRLKAATPISVLRGRRASAEYRVDEHLSTQLIWQDDETVSSAGDLGLDLKLRWEWE